MDITPEDLQNSIDTNISGAFAFSRESILAFKQLPYVLSIKSLLFCLLGKIFSSLEEGGARGTLIFTGATASIRGNVTTSAFAAGKFALRALSQSLGKEFGKEDIHVRPPFKSSPLLRPLIGDRIRLRLPIPLSMVEYIRMLLDREEMTLSGRRTRLLESIPIALLRFVHTDLRHFCT